MNLRLRLHGAGQILGRLSSRPKEGRLGIAFTRGRSVKFMKCAEYELCLINFSLNQKSLETWETGVQN